MTLQARILFPLAMLLAAGLIAQTPSDGGAKPYPAGRPFTPVDPLDQVKTMQRGGKHHRLRPPVAQFRERALQRAPLSEDSRWRVSDGPRQPGGVFPHGRGQQAQPRLVHHHGLGDQELAQNHLTVIVDEHDYTVCGNNADTCKPKLLAFWKQVAARYQDAPPGVVFEILNEPNGQLTRSCGTHGARRFSL